MPEIRFITYHKVKIKHKVLCKVISGSFSQLAKDFAGSHITLHSYQRQKYLSVCSEALADLAGASSR